MVMAARTARRVRLKTSFVELRIIEVKHVTINLSDQLLPYKGLKKQITITRVKIEFIIKVVVVYYSFCYTGQL